MTLPVAREEARSFDFETFMPSLGRSAFAGGLAALAGGLAGGIALRLGMRAVALLDAEATGRLTENGAVVGAITTEGSIFLVMFGAIFGMSIGVGDGCRLRRADPGPARRPRRPVRRGDAPRVRLEPRRQP